MEVVEVGVWLAGRPPARKTLGEEARGGGAVVGDEKGRRISRRRRRDELDGGEALVSEGAGRRWGVREEALGRGRKRRRRASAPSFV